MFAAAVGAMGSPATLGAPSDSAFVQWARAHAQPLPPSDTVSDGAFEPFGAIVGRARVVAFGEPAHDTHEPLAFRNRLFRYLVERLGFTTIVLESGLTESYRVHQYVSGDAGDLTEVVANGITWGFGRLAESRELVGWLRQYNQDSVHRRKVHFYGMDLTGGDTDQLPQARRAVDFALRYLASRDPSIGQNLANRFEPYLERFSASDYRTLSPADRVKLSGLIDELREAIERAGAADGGEALDWALRSAMVARQLETFFRLTPAEMPTLERPAGGNMSRASGARDSSMAANLRWILSREGPTARVLVFAHNNHIMNAPLTGGIWTPLRVTSPVLGVNLRRWLHQDLVLIASSAASVSGGLPPLEPDPNSLDDLFARVGFERFVLDFRAARSDRQAWAWLGRPRSFRSAITSHVRIVPRTAYDAVVYLGSLSPAQH